MMTQQNSWHELTLMTVCHAVSLDRRCLHWPLQELPAVPESGSNEPCLLPCISTAAAVMNAVVKGLLQANWTPVHKSMLACVLILKGQACWEVSGREKVNRNLALLFMLNEMLSVS